ncbi:Kef-type potassium/proton antiporter, CPA2 family [Algoriphagus faecimaris]|uniref:Kef-type potassium/proton antiporter, CPA2 family n=1 Tax=Algoriphagus faecimaris TaxID=686796 RepID=A0A1G6VIJ8_9BACT|nr:monovalent cation:proton antiporter-2 (CPA2) family protein [Algoriphagus faecimaris]SDD53331.1 Kef-type potassium/proton antiporter, CPA2 family [Algoriphagus faecimaris]
MTGFLLTAIVFILAAILFVPIAKKLGMGSVLGYLIAGIVIGPYLLGFIESGNQGQDIMHTTEFGVVIMLFLIGLELDPDNLWKMRDLIIRVGLLQVLTTAALIFGLAVYLGMDWKISLAISLSMALSSTAIVLSSLKEKNQMGSPVGKMSFGVLLMQDIAVIPILAIIPLLASTAGEIAGNSHSGTGFINSLPTWAQTLSIFGAIGLVVLMGRFGFGPLLKWVSKTRLRELFTASALLIVFGISWLMQVVGLSPALGAFIAGVILANSPYRHALESDLEPFKGLLLGLFFMAVGATINFDLILGDPIPIISVTLGVMLLKFLVLFGIGKIRKLNLSQNISFAIGLSQVSEFSFVTYAFALQFEVIGPELSDQLMAITALTMTFTPLVAVVAEKGIIPRMVENTNETEENFDSIHEKNEVILLGFGNFGSTIGRFLRANGVESTILDYDPERIDFLRKMGFKVYFGDGTQVSVLKTAGADEAKILISAIDTPAQNLQVVEICKEHFPHLEVLVRAKNRYDAYELMESGVRNIYREHIDTSIRMGEDVLKKIGFRAHTVHRLAAQFMKYDEEALKILVNFKNDENEYIHNAKKHIEQQENLLSGELMKKFSLNDHAWDSDSLKENS